MRKVYLPLHGKSHDKHVRIYTQNTRLTYINSMLDMPALAIRCSFHTHSLGCSFACCFSCIERGSDSGGVRYVPCTRLHLTLSWFPFGLYLVVGWSFCHQRSGDVYTVCGAMATKGIVRCMHGAGRGTWFPVRFWFWK